MGTGLPGLGRRCRCPRGARGATLLPVRKTRPRESHHDRHHHRHRPQRRRHRHAVRDAGRHQGPAGDRGVPVPGAQPLDRRRPQPQHDQGLLRRLRGGHEPLGGLHRRRRRAGHPARHRHGPQPGRVPAARARRLRHHVAASPACPVTSAVPPDPDGRWSATPGTSRTRSPPTASPTRCATPSCSPAPSSPPRPDRSATRRCTTTRTPATGSRHRCSRSPSGSRPTAGTSRSCATCCRRSVPRCGPRSRHCARSTNRPRRGCSCEPTTTTAHGHMDPCGRSRALGTYTRIHVAVARAGSTAGRGRPRPPGPLAASTPPASAARPRRGGPRSARTPPAAPRSPRW